MRDNASEKPALKERLKAHRDEYKVVYLSMVGACVVSVVVCAIHDALNDYSDTYTYYGDNGMIVTRNGSYSEANVRLSHPGKRVRDEESGEEWDSVRQCERETGISRHVITRCLDGVYDTANGRSLSYLGDAF